MTTNCESINKFPFQIGDRIVVDRYPELGIGTITTIDLVDHNGNPYYSLEEYGVTTLKAMFSEGQDNGEYILWSNRITRVVDNRNIE